MFILALLLMQLGRKYFIITEQTYLSPFLFVLICSAFPLQKCMNGSYVATLFFIISLFHLLKVYREEKSYAAIFYAGMFLSCGVLFAAPAIFLLLLLPVALLLFRSVLSWRDWVIAIAGAAIPFLYTYVAYFFIVGDGREFFFILYECLFSLSSWILENGRIIEWVYLAFILFLVFQAMLMVLKGLLTTKIRVQKIHTLLLWAFFVLLIISLFLPSGSMLLMPLVALPASVLMANYFMMTKFRKFAGLNFLILIVLTFLVQFL
jgi:hypothetical protein